VLGGVTRRQLFERYERADSSPAFAALDELLRAGVLQQRDNYYVLGQRALVDVLVRTSDEATRTQLHVRVAEVFANPVYAAHWLPVRQLQLAGEHTRARELLLKLASALATGAAQWGAMRVSLNAECALTALEHWQAHGGTTLDGLVLRRHLLIVCPVYDWSLARFGVAQLAQLSSDCGITHWPETDVAQPELQRVFECLKLAGQEYETKGEVERGLPPIRRAA
jgi:hypothetical protein